MTRISVTIIQREGRKFFEARWIDPHTGAKKTKSTKLTQRRAAERFAMELERKLNSPEEEEVRRATWKAFRQEYEEDVFPSQKLKTRLTTTSTFNAIESILNPASPQSINTEAIRKFTKGLRQLPGKHRKPKKEEAPRPVPRVSEFTVVRHLTELRKILNWAAANKFIAVTPPIRVPDAKGRKGRDVTSEEFERMLLAVRTVKCLAANQWESYEFFLKGLWWSGLRLQEALDLDWEDDTKLCVDLFGKRPVFRIQATNDKGGKYRVLPMAPEFAELLETVPPTDRYGKVFKLATQSGIGNHLADRAGHVISAIGEKAGVFVAERPGGHKWASAHDLRRAFGVRWAGRVLPPVLMELMRHEDIKTTMAFYVGRNAERSADEAWAAYERTQLGNRSGNSPPKGHTEPVS